MSSTVIDLLETARAFCSLAERETNRDSGKLERAAQYAAIAQAHAITAQAMLANRADDMAIWQLENLEMKSGDPNKWLD